MIISFNFHFSDEAEKEREVLEEIETVVRHKKIECMAALVKATVTKIKNPEADINFMKIIKDYDI